MDENLPYTPAGENWNDSIARSLDEQRARARKFLSGYNERLADLESDLTSQVEQILQQLAHAKGERDDGALELAGQTEQLTKLQEMLDKREDEWRAEQTVIEQQHRDAVEQLRIDQEQLQLDLAELRHGREELEQLESQRDAFAQDRQILEQEQQAQQQQLEDLQQREDALQARQTGEVAELEERIGELEAQLVDSQQQAALAGQFPETQQQLDAALERAEQADKRITELETQLVDSQQQLDRQQSEAQQQAAHTDLMLIELQQQHKQLQGQFQQQAGQIEEQTRTIEDADRKLADETAQRMVESEQSQQQVETLSTQLERAVAKGGADQEDLREQLTAHKKQLNQRAEELTSLRDQVAQLNEEQESLNQQLATASASGDADTVALSQERDKLNERVAELETRLADSDGTASTADLQDLQKRFELAIEDVRELKKQNSRLEERVARGGSATTPAADAPGEGFDWETQKQRLLESLESDFDEADEADKKTKLTIEGTMRITDEVVAAKDQEISELTRLLDDQSNRVGDVAVGAAAIAGMLDQDELILQEREGLKQAKEEWREKLGKAETEISVERAKIARERAKFEEQIRELTSRLGGDAASDSPSSTQANDAKPARGRWLAKLGLKDKDDE